VSENSYTLNMWQKLNNLSVGNIGLYSSLLKQANKYKYFKSVCTQLSTKWDNRRYRQLPSATDKTYQLYHLFFCL